MHPGGPSHNSIFAITQDHQGFLWIGTQDGLNRFDGYDFEVYRQDPTDPATLSANRVNAILEDSKRRLWIGTSTTIDRFDRSSGHFFRYPLPEPSTGPILDLVEGPTGTVWSAAASNVLRYRPRADHWEAILSAPPPGQVRRVRESPTGSIWFLVDSPGAEANQLCRLDPVANEGWNQECDSVGIALGFDLDGQGVPHLGALPGDRFDPTRAREPEFILPSRTTDRLVLDVLIEESGRIWAATDRGLETNTMVETGDPAASRTLSDLEHPFGERPDMLSGYVSRVYRDRSQTVWLGTEHGLYRYDPFAKPMRHHGLHEVPSSQGGILHRGPAISALAEDREGRIWVGSFEAGGLYRLDPTSGRWDTNPLGDRVPAQHVWSLLSDGSHLWIGFSSSLCRSELPDGPLRCTPLEATSQAIVRDARGRLWRSGHGEILRLEATDSWTRYSFQAPDLNPDASEILHLLADVDSLWIGSWGGPLRRFDLEHETFELWPRVDARGWEQISPIFDLQRTPDGYLWLATGDGLSRFDPTTESFLHYGHSDGLPGSNVYSILPEPNEGLWLGTNRGLARLRVATSGELAAVRTFGISDGVVNIEFNRNARLRTRDGRFLFGGLDGVTEFLPWGIRPNPIPPPLALTHIEVLGDQGSRSVEPYGLEMLTLEPNDRALTIDYVALSFTDSERNLYAFRLAGFEDQWVEAGGLRRARYANLPPGEYVFELRAANNDGLWSDDTLRLGVRVQPAIWETWWFRTGLLLAGAGLLAAAHRLRVRRKVEVERLRLRIAGDLHDDLGSDLSGIALAAARISNREYLDPRDRRQLRDVESTSHQIMDSLRDIVWYINPEHDALASLTGRMRSLAGRLLTDHEVRFVATTVEVREDRPLPMRLRRELFLSYKELLHNILRHAGARRVAISLITNSESIRLVVEDDGVGFDPQGATEGTGLASLRRRALRLAATLNLESVPGRTTIDLRVPWPG